jgi:ribosomal-protein-alanine N-acetyltransferase
MHRRWAFTLVAEKTDPELAAETVGFVVAEAGRGGVGHIITIDVLPTVRRYGVGSKLLTAAEDRLRIANCHDVFLETAVDNQTALSFYKRHRYFLMKTVPRYYSNGVDAFVLQKDLL